MEQTRIKKTEYQYIKKTLQSMNSLYKKFKGNEKIENIKESIEFNEKKYEVVPIYETVIWYCKNKAHEYKPSTWRFYRSAFIFFATEEFLKNKINEEKLNKIKLLLKKTESGKKEFLPNRTSSKKSKYLNDKDLKLLIEEISKTKNKWKIATILWIQSGLISGLRPIEWQNVEINYNEKNQIILKVKNAKNTNQRSHGEYRLIDLTFLEEKEKNLIEKHIKISQGFYKNNLWKSYYEGCSNLLRYTSRNLWKKKEKYPTLYSCRHQFSANIKASGYTTEEVAALMGHASNKTAQIHYGKKRYGKSGKGPKPNKEDIKNVRIKNNNIFEFNNDKK